MPKVNRIPPKGTEGYRLYYSDRRSYELANQQADDWLDFARGAMHEKRKLVLLYQAGRCQAMAQALRTMWEQADYNKPNPYEGIDTP